MELQFFVDIQVPEAGEKEGKKGEKIRNANVHFLMKSHMRLQRKNNIQLCRHWRILEIHGTLPSFSDVLTQQKSPKDCLI